MAQPETLADTGEPPLAELLLRALAELDRDGCGVALTRLAKHLDQRASVLIRLCTQLSDARLGPQTGPGWVRLTCEDERWSASITELGREVLQAPSP